MSDERPQVSERGRELLRQIRRRYHPGGMPPPPEADLVSPRAPGSLPFLWEQTALQHLAGEERKQAAIARLQQPAETPPPPPPPPEPAPELTRAEIERQQQDRRKQALGPRKPCNCGQKKRV